MQYITEEEKARLEAELKERSARRKELSTRIDEARQLGDLKENAEYHAAREDQGLNEAKIRELEAKLKDAIVTSGEDLPQDMVFIGARVRLRDVKSGKEQLYSLVGEASGKLDEEIIEVTTGSPLGESLLKSRVGEVIRVDLRRGPKRFEIVEIVS